MVAEHKAFPPTDRLIRAPWLDYVSPQHAAEGSADVFKEKTNTADAETQGISETLVGKTASSQHTAVAQMLANIQPARYSHQVGYEEDQGLMLW